VSRQFHHVTALLPVKLPNSRYNWGLGKTEDQSGHLALQKNIFPMQEFEPRFLGCPSHCAATVQLVRLGQAPSSACWFRQQGGFGSFLATAAVSD
jgi:hypothetical protein